MIARVHGRVLDPAWEQRPVALEELVLAYLRNREASVSALPQLTAAAEANR